MISGRIADGRAGAFAAYIARERVVAKAVALYADLVDPTFAKTVTTVKGVGSGIGAGTVAVIAKAVAAGWEALPISAAPIVFADLVTVAAMIGVGVEVDTLSSATRQPGGAIAEGPDAHFTGRVAAVFARASTDAIKTQSLVCARDVALSTVVDIHLQPNADIVAEDFDRVAVGFGLRFGLGFGFGIGFGVRCRPRVS